MFIECVVNLSEGRRQLLLNNLAATCAPVLIDRHTDPDHHRSVFTLAGPSETVIPVLSDLARAALEHLDLSAHQGVHPRLGVLDVVPFVPYEPGQLPQHDLSGVVLLRDAFARWLGDELDIPSFLYGPLAHGQTRTLPQVRKGAFIDVSPDAGPGQPHPSAGATAVGARSVLVAYNVWVDSAEVARRVAPLVRRAEVRTLGLDLGSRAQVSCNLVDPAVVGPAQVYDSVARAVEATGGTVLGAELVGLLPEAVLARIPPGRWAELDLSAATTIEAGLDRLT